MRMTPIASMSMPTSSGYAPEQDRSGCDQEETDSNSSAVTSVRGSPLRRCLRRGTEKHAEARGSIWHPLGPLVVSSGVAQGSHRRFDLDRAGRRCDHDGHRVLVDWLPERRRGAPGDRPGVLGHGRRSASASSPSWRPCSLYSGVRFRVKPDDLRTVRRSTGTRASRSPGPRSRSCSSPRSPSSARSCSRRTTRAGQPAARQRVRAAVRLEFEYPGTTGSQADEPVRCHHRRTELDSRPLDVLHSFWVPEFGPEAGRGSRDHHERRGHPDGSAVPVICTELCGLGHAMMRATAIVMTQGGIRKWRNRPARRPRRGAGAQGGLQANGCGACHTFKPAGHREDRPGSR